MEEKKLIGSLHKLQELSPSQKKNLFQLMDRYYFISEEGFSSDLSKKDFVILLCDEAGEIKGFTTIMLINSRIEDEEFRAIFSGDTIIEKEYWGSLELPKIWGRFMLSQIEEAKGKPLYWFLISSGYKTYRFLPVFFKEFYPSFEKQTPEKFGRLIELIGKMLFQDGFISDKGVIKLENPTPLKEGVADISEDRRKDSHISFFLSRNPGYYLGDELACIAKLEIDNIKPFMRRVLKG
ncbi:MAG: hypothetical protein HQM08_17790 [Candidatus Riflebacteria bacterium]|nr:hypothetical protein [Candidatus Riflebacteria bacterium]